MNFKAVILLIPVLLCGQIRRPTAPMSTDERIGVFESWVKADPKDLSNHTLLASAYIQKTRETSDFAYLNRASAIIDKVLAEKKDYEAMRLRNIIELNWHHFAKVVEYTRQMTQETPTDPQNWGNLGDALMEIGDYDAAHTAFEKMLSIRPNLFSYNRLAYYYFVMGDTDKATSTMSQAVKAGSAFIENVAWCLVELGNMYFKTGRLDEARAAYERALSDFPTHQAYAGLGSVQAAQGKTSDAIASYLKAQSMTPMPQYAGVLHDLYILSGNKQQAQKQLEMVDLVAKLEKAANQNANRTLALIYANQDRNLEHALELAKADFEVRHDVYTYDALAWVLYKNKQYEEAAKASAEALKLHTPEPLFYYHSGVIAHQLGNNDAAKQDLERAIELNSYFDVAQSAAARRLLAELS